MLLLFSGIFSAQLMRVGLNVIGAKILSSCPIPSVAGTNSVRSSFFFIAWCQ